MLIKVLLFNKYNNFLLKVHFNKTYLDLATNLVVMWIYSNMFKIISELFVIKCKIFQSLRVEIIITLFISDHK